MYDKTPWGMIRAKQETSKVRGNLDGAQIGITKALELLKKEKPDVEQAIKALEEALKQSNGMR